VQELLEAGRVLSTATVLFHAAVAETAGLSITESKAMEVIQRLGPLTAGTLARETGLAPASVTALLDRLTAKGVARRLPHPSDQRRILVEIDPDYERRNAALFEEFVTGLRHLCAQYDADEIRLIARFLHAAAEIQQGAAAGLVDLK
jgi:DNA-binding MarR family transcriptional regulator